MEARRYALPETAFECPTVRSAPAEPEKSLTATKQKGPRVSNNPLLVRLATPAVMSWDPAAVQPLEVNNAITFYVSILNRPGDICRIRANASPLKRDKTKLDELPLRHQTHFVKSINTKRKTPDATNRCQTYAYAIMKAQK